MSDFLIISQLGLNKPIIYIPLSNWPLLFIFKNIIPFIINKSFVLIIKSIVILLFAYSFLIITFKHFLSLKKVKFNISFPKLFLENNNINEFIKLDFKIVYKRYKYYNFILLKVFGKCYYSVFLLFISFLFLNISYIFFFIFKDIILLLFVI